MPAGRSTQHILGTQPYLSPDAFFLTEADACYLFAPLTRTYSRVNADLELLLRHCDGSRTVVELITDYQLAAETVDLFATLLAKGILRPKKEGEPSSTDEEPEDGPRPFTHLTLFPTHACNLACVYCYASGGDRPGWMSPRTAQVVFDAFFDQLPEEQELAALSFHGGGEPTLAFPFIREAAADFASRSERRGLKPHVSMVTNGVFGQEVLRWILDEGVGVNFSFDGPPAVQDRQRPFRDGRGSHAIVTENMNFLRAAGRDITVRATVTADSLAYMGELVDECLELGVGALQLEPCFSVGRCEESGATAPDPDEFAERFLEAYRRGLTHDMAVTYSGLRCIDTPRDRFCGACGDSVAVTPEGYLTACFEVVHVEDPAARVFFVGHVDGNTEKVWLDEERLHTLRSRTTPNLVECSDCFLKYSCAGDCVVKSFRARGTIFSRVPDRCRMAEIVNKTVIGWIADGIIVPRDERSFEQYLY